jgi:hypothetical protein
MNTAPAAVTATPTHTMYQEGIIYFIEEVSGEFVMALTNGEEAMRELEYLNAGHTW